MINKPRRPIKSISIYFFLPIILFRYLFDYVFNTYISIVTKANILSGKYYCDEGFDHLKSFRYIKKIKIKDITNRKLRYSLYLTSLFRPWHIYMKSVAKETTSDLNNRDSIYISRTKLETCDDYIGERLSDHNLNKLFKTKYRKQRKNKEVYNSTDHWKLEKQYYVLCTKYTELHKQLKEYSKVKYEYDKQTELKKAVKDAIETSNFNTNKNFTGKLLGGSLIEHLLYYKEYDYLHKIYDSLDYNDKKYFINVLNEFVYERYINDERKEYIKQFN
jgi:hypothetical protein